MFEYFEGRLPNYAKPEALVMRLKTAVPSHGIASD